MREIRTAYTWLGIEENATDEEIKKAWREAAKKHHPDRGGDEKTFQKMKSSYECLIDSGKRRKYDLKIKKVRLQERLRSTQEKAAAAFQTFWQQQEMEEREFQRRREEARRQQEQVNRNRASSEHSSYFAEQERAEREWRKEYDSMMENYWEEQRTSVGVEKVLHSTDELLYSILSDGIVRMGKAKLERDPVTVGVDTEVKVDGKAKEVVEDLRDSILKAERLVRMFNKFTGGV